jgi:GDSL-like Lipase/Acylhydrolase family
MRAMERKHLGIGLVAASAVGALLLATRSKSKAPLVGKSDRVVLIGDSLGVGLRKPLGALAQADGIPFMGQACGGTMIFQWVRQDTNFGPCTFGQQHIRAANPTVVLISLGTNDAYAQADQIESERPKLEELLQDIIDMGARPIWIDPPKLETAPRVPQVMQMIYDSPTARKAGMPHFRSDQMDIQMTGDKIHPTRAGYDAWSTALWKWLRTPR